MRLKHFSPDCADYLPPVYQVDNVTPTTFVLFFVSFLLLDFIFFIVSVIISLLFFPQSLKSTFSIYYFCLSSVSFLSVFLSGFADYKKTFKSKKKQKQKQENNKEIDLFCIFTCSLAHSLEYFRHICNIIYYKIQCVSSFGRVAIPVVGD